MNPVVITVADAGRKLRLSKMQVAGHKVRASRDGRLLGGFFKRDGVVHPVTKPFGRGKTKVKPSSKKLSVRPRKQTIRSMSDEGLKLLHKQLLETVYKGRVFRDAPRLKRVVVESGRRKTHKRKPETVVYQDQDLMIVKHVAAKGKSDMASICF